MTARIYLDQHADAEVLDGKCVGVIGYGSQGRAHALNLRDSSIDVVVGLRTDSPSRGMAAAEGFTPVSIEEASAAADIVAMLVPDQVQPDIYRDNVEPHLTPGTTLLFAHGFNIHYGLIAPPDGSDVIMVGPKSPGPILRRTFETGGGVPALVAIAADVSGQAHQRALAYAKAIGCTRAGAILTSFAEETETDLFGEQAVLAGGTARLVELGFETLVEAGYQPEIAYLECLHELKLVVDIMQERGIVGMGRAISDTAEYGSLTRGRTVLSEAVRDGMKRVLAEIRSGEFAHEWLTETKAGAPTLNRERRRVLEHPLEKVGAAMREITRGMPQ